MAVVGGSTTGKTTLINNFIRVLENDSFSWRLAEGAGHFRTTIRLSVQRSCQFNFYDTPGINDDSQQSQIPELAKQMRLRGIGAFQNPDDEDIIQNIEKTDPSREDRIDFFIYVVDIISCYRNGLYQEGRIDQLRTDLYRIKSIDERMLFPILYFSDYNQLDNQRSYFGESCQSIVQNLIKKLRHSESRTFYFPLYLRANLPTQQKTEEKILELLRRIYEELYYQQ